MMRWACAAVVTPIDGSGRIDTGKLHGFIERLYGHGINGVVLFGTMGEGPAFSVAERLEATARLIELGLDPDELGYWNGAAHLHSFNLPKFLSQAVERNDRVITDANPLIAPSPVGTGAEGKARLEMLERTSLGGWHIADPDGVLLDIVA